MIEQIVVRDRELRAHEQRKDASEHEEEQRCAGIQEPNVGIIDDRQKP